MPPSSAFCKIDRELLTRCDLVISFRPPIQRRTDRQRTPRARRSLAAELRTIQETYALRASQRRASADVVDVARAATYGLVDTVLVDIDAVVPGRVDEETGAANFDDTDDAVNYGVVDEIARRVWLNGGNVLAVRRDDIPGNGSVAAILRYAPVT